PSATRRTTSPSSPMGERCLWFGWWFSFIVTAVSLERCSVVVIRGQRGSAADAHRKVVVRVRGRRRQRVRDHLPCPVQAAHDRAQRHAQDLRDLTVLHPFNTPEQQ